MGQGVLKVMGHGVCGGSCQDRECVGGVMGQGVWGGQLS